MEAKEVTLSACIIALDAEDTLPKCLDSIKDAVDEIILCVDDRTTDNTAEIGKQYGAKVSHYKWTDNFSEARNLSIEKAISDFILIIDADEYFPQGASQHIIRPFINENSYDRGKFVVKSFTPTGASENPQLRIFRNGSVQYSNIVHNVPISEGTFATLPTPLLHDGYNLPLDKMMAKYKRTERLLLKQIEELNDMASWMYLVRNYRTQERWSDCIEAYEKGLKTTCEGSYNTIYQQMAGDAVYAYLISENFRQGIELALPLLAKYPDNIDVTMYLAHLYAQSDRHREAIDAYNRYLYLRTQYKADLISSSLILDTIEQAGQAYMNLARIYRLQNESEKALSAYRHSMRQGANQNAIQAYIDLLEKESAFYRVKVGKLKVMFLQPYICARNIKMALALRSKGHLVSVAYQNESLERYGLEGADIYHEIIALPPTNSTTMLATAMEVAISGYDIIHSHNEPDILTVIAQGVIQPEQILIHDCHDLMTTRGDGNQVPELRYYERMANTHSDGRVYVSSTQAKQAHDLYQYDTQTTMVFHSYASGAHLPDEDKPKLSESTGQYHIVYQGGVRQAGHRNIADMLMAIAEKAIHVHIQPAFHEPSYENMAKGSEFLHYNKPVTPDKLLTELTQYDAGLICFKAEGRNAEMLQASMPNKLFEYLAVGLPVIAGNFNEMAKFVTDNNVGIVYDSVDDIVDGIDTLKEITIEEPEKYVMENNIGKLIGFYGHLLKMKQGDSGEVEE